MQVAAIRMALGVGLLAGAAGAAQAQMPGGMMPGMNGGFTPMVKPDAPAAKPSSAAPPALPGATPGFGAAPTDKSVSDLGPNDALFDAINRGDIHEARDAVNRGADINAHNVLGMTPLELSVDLSRNNITFFLLSLRGATEGAMSDKLASLPGKPGADPKPPARPAKAAAKAAVPKHTPATIPLQYAGAADLGQPDPQMGFLGFGRSAP